MNRVFRGDKILFIGLAITADKKEFLRRIITDNTEVFLELLLIAVPDFQIKNGAAHLQITAGYFFKIKTVNSKQDC